MYWLAIINIIINTVKRTSICFSGGTESSEGIKPGEKLHARKHRMDLGVAERKGRLPE